MRSRRPAGRSADMPLIVLTAGRPNPQWNEETSAKGIEETRKTHEEFAALSTRGEQRTIDAGHAIQLEKTDAVVSAIEEVLALARASQGAPL
jgi:hypothetical protein